MDDNCEMPRCRGMAVARVLVHPVRSGREQAEELAVCSAHADGWENLAEPPRRSLWARLTALVS